MGKYYIHMENQKEQEKEDILYEFIREFHICINGFGHQDLNTSINYCDNRINTDFEMIYVIDGENEIEIENVKYKGKKGDLFLIPPFSRHCIHTTKEKMHINYWLHFDVEPFYLSEKLLCAITGDKNEYKVTVELDTEILEILESIEVESENMKPGYKTIRNNLFQNLLILMFRQGFEKNNKKEFDKMVTSHEKQVLEGASNYMLEHMNQFITIKQVCDNLYISESYLYKVFDKVISISPMYYMQLLRAKKARVLLDTTSLSIKEISEMLGFSSVYYFSNFFKKIYGVSPKNYQN